VERASALGGLMLAVSIPSMLLILQGGVIVDRVNVKKLMLVTKGILAISALTLAALTEFSQVQMWQLYIFALIEGITISFDSPAFQALAVRLIPKNEFKTAITLNSTNFHTSRMLGPLVAGVLLAWHGPSLVFLFDGLSYLGIMFVLLSIELFPKSKSKFAIPSNRLQALKQGFYYFYKNPRLRFKLMQFLLIICVIFPILIVIFRTYLRIKFSLQADEFGFLFTMPAMGAMVGAMMITALQPKKPIKLLLFAVPGMSMLLVAVVLAESLFLTTILLVFTGFFSYLNFVSLTLSLHLEILDEFRGRLGSLLGLGFVSIGPLMSYPIGYFADHVGYQLSTIILAVCFMLGTGVISVLYMRQRQVKTTKNIKDLKTFEKML